MSKTITRLGISLDTELYLDILFEMGKAQGVIQPENSIGTYLAKKLRPIVPKRNVQVTYDSNEIDDAK